MNAQEARVNSTTETTSAKVSLGQLHCYLYLCAGQPCCLLPLIESQMVAKRPFFLDASHHSNTNVWYISWSTPLTEVYLVYSCQAQIHGMTDMSKCIDCPLQCMAFRQRSTSLKCFVFLYSDQEPPYSMITLHEMAETGKEKICSSLSFVYTIFLSPLFRISLKINFQCLSEHDLPWGWDRAVLFPLRLGTLPAK